MSDLPPPGPPPGPPTASQPEQPAQPPMGWLRLTLQGSVLTSNLITPAVSVNGYRVPAQYGENVIPVHAGPNRVEVSCQWVLRYGEASLETYVPPGEQVPLFYAAPFHQFTRGAIGYEKQKRPGAPGLTLLVLFIVLVAVLVVVLPAALP